MSDGLEELLAETSAAGDDQRPKGGGLRAQLEEVLAERKALRDQLAQLQTAQRQRDLGELFAKHQVPELARDFFPADAELNEKAVGEFVEKYGQLWGHQPAAAVTDPAEQVAARAMASVAGTAASPPQGPLSEADYRAKFAEAKNMADLRQMMADLGALG